MKIIDGDSKGNGKKYRSMNTQGIRNKQKKIILEFIQRKIDIAVFSETKKGNSKLK